MVKGRNVELRFTTVVPSFETTDLIKQPLITQELFFNKNV
jgi:hypothetical protein